jgi:ATP-binding cassette, subfamily B, bacterial
VDRTDRKGAAPGGRSIWKGFGNLVRLWSRLGPYLEGNRARMALFSAAALGSGFGEAILLFAVVRAATGIAAGELVVEVSAGPLPRVEATLTELLVGSLVLLAVLVTLSLATSYLAARMSTVAIVNARHRTFDAFVDATWGVQALERNGHLQELLTTDAKKVGQGALVVSDGVTAFLGFLAFLVSALVISPGAAITILVGVLALYLALRPVIRLTRSKSRDHAARNRDYALALTEAASLARELRAFDAHDVVRADVNRRADATGQLHFWTKFLTKATPALYQNAGLLLVVLGMIGAYQFDVGDLSALGAVVLLLVRALSKSQGLQSSIQQAGEISPYLDRMTAQRRSYRESGVRFGDVALPRVTSVELREVSYGYEPCQHVLHDLSFTVGEGETIGIVGPSASGKSTLVQILLRLRAPDSGVYLVNGQPAEVYSPASWSKQLAFVPQDNLLLHATVRDNVRFHRPWIDDHAIERACRLAHLHDEIVAMPAGYETLVGSGGMSGGQRQRLGLARALAGHPTVVVLDEPTSALDMQSEAFIQATLDELKGHVTLFVVAHRLSTTQRCDRIMVMRDGCLDAFQSPDHLASNNDFYQEAIRLARLS